MDEAKYQEASDSRPYYALLQQYNCDENLTSVIDTLVDSEYLQASQIDHELLTSIAEYPSDVAVNALQAFGSDAYTGTSTDVRTAIGELLQQYNSGGSQQPSTAANPPTSQGHKVASLLDLSVTPNRPPAAAGARTPPSQSRVRLTPDKEAAIQALVQKTGFKLEQTQGQRRFHDPNYKTDQPGPGCELYIGHIPKDMYEDELYEMLIKIGPLNEIRIMLENGESRGFCFAVFQKREDAQKANNELAQVEVRGRRLKLGYSQPNTRLYVGNIPKHLGKEELLEQLSEVITGMVDIIVYPMADNPQKKNRGFCFVEFESHNLAAGALRKLQRVGQKLWRGDLMLEWADPIDEPDEQTMQKVKTLFVSNLHPEATLEIVRQKFATVGALKDVKRMKDYAFVEYEQREDALKAIELFNDKELTLGNEPTSTTTAEGATDASGDQVVGHLKMRVTLARPLTDRMKEVRNQRKRAEQEGGFFPGGGMGMGMGAMGMGMGAMGMGMGGFGGAGMGFGGSGGGRFGSGGGGGRGARGRGARGGAAAGGGGGWAKGGFGGGSGFQQQQQQGSYWDASSYGGMSGMSGMSMGGMSMGGMSASPFGGYSPKPSRPPRGGRGMGMGFAGGSRGRGRGGGGGGMAAMSQMGMSPYASQGFGMGDPMAYGGMAAYGGMGGMGGMGGGYMGGGGGSYMQQGSSFRGGRGRGGGGGGSGGGAGRARGRGLKSKPRGGRGAGGVRGGNFGSKRPRNNYDANGSSYGGGEEAYDPSQAAGDDGTGYEATGYEGSYDQSGGGQQAQGSEDFWSDAAAEGGMQAF